MIQMGDETLRTQSGNNNVYCQDNPTSWLNWQPGLRGRNATICDGINALSFGVKRRTSAPFSLAKALEAQNGLAWRTTISTWIGATLRMRWA